MLKEILTERGIGELQAFNAEAWTETRKTYVNVLCKEEYGTPIPEPTKLSFEVDPEKRTNRRFCAGDAVKYEVIAHDEINGKDFSFPFTAVIPNREGIFPFIIHNDFEYLVPSKYLPAEEMVNNGFNPYKTDIQALNLIDMTQYTPGK